MSDDVWIDAARYEFDKLAEPADDTAVERLAAHIEELASLDPNERTEYALQFVGAEREAMLSWISDTDESDGR